MDRVFARRPDSVQGEQRLNPASPADAGLGATAGMPMYLNHARAWLGDPGEAAEQQADAIADRVLMTHTGGLRAAEVTPTGSSTTPQGERLAEPYRAELAQSLGQNLDDVRIHTAPDAAESARSLGAHAFAVGQDIYFGANQYQPATETGQRLLVHELAHVTQDRSGAHVRRHIVNARSADADNDQTLLSILQTQSVAILIDEAEHVGGLTGWRRRLPLSFPLMRQRAVAAWGEHAIATLEAQDATVLELVSKASEVTRQLLDLREQFQTQTDEDLAAVELIDFYIGKHYLFRADEHGLYELSYAYFASRLWQDDRFDFRLYQNLLTGRAEDIVYGVTQNMADVAQEAHNARLQRDAWTAAAARFVGTRVAHRSGIFINTGLRLESLVDPMHGSENYDDMLAVARLHGHMSAVMRIGKRFYVFDLDEDMDRQEIFAARNWDQASLIVGEDVKDARTMAVVTSDAFVVEPRQDAEVMFGGDQARRPLEYLEADTRLLESGRDSPHGFAASAPVLFQSMVRNLALVNLADAEQRLRSIWASMSPGFGVDPVAGRALQEDTARLRDLTAEAQRLADEIGDASPSEGQAAQRDELMSEIGSLIEKNPAAAFFVAKPERSSTLIRIISPTYAALNDLGSDDPKDQLEGLQPGDAASRAIEEVRERLDNIGTVRRAMFDDPDIVLGFEPLFDPVYSYFSSSERTSIQISLGFRTLDHIASSLKMLAVDLGLLLVGLATEGVGWIGFLAEAGGSGIAVYQLQQQYAQTQLASAMAAVDIPGGFELESPEAAASARRWFLFSAALTFFGLVGLTRTAGRLMRETAAEAGRVGRLARAAGVSEEAMAGAFRTTWRGLRRPDPDALREILLARMPKLAREEYAGIEIHVLDEAEWAARFPSRPAEHAATRFASQGDQVVAKEIFFRAQGNPLALQEEAEHILQATGSELSGSVFDVVRASRDWAKLSPLQKLRATESVLHIELDAQERLLARAQSVGDTEALDDAFAEMESISQQQVQLDRALADPNVEPPSWFNPAEAPEVLFNKPRLPRSRGRWDNPNAPGNSTWFSTRKEVRDIVGPTGAVEFRNGYPNFWPWKKAEVRLAHSGTASDFADADARLAENIISGRQPMPPGYTRADFMHQGDPIAAGVERYRRAEGLTWHHHEGGNILILVPTKLHANIPHTGGASAARAAGP